MKKILSFIMLLIFVFTFISCGNKKENISGVYINEVCTSNKNNLSTSNYDYYDWIELYNSNDKDISLYSAYFTDKDSKHKSSLSNLTIKAKSYQIIYFTDEEVLDNSCNFNLSKSGEEIYLYNYDDTLIDSVIVPKIDENTCYGRVPDGVGEFKNIVATPNESNDDAIIYKKVNNPVFSIDSGFYNENTVLEITQDKNVSIYYTTDSSIPTTESTKYTRPITLTNCSSNDNVLKNREDICLSSNKYTSKTDKCNVIRAIAIDSDGNKSDIITKSYFVGIDKYNNDRYDIVSLVSDIDNFTNPKTGIYVRGEAYDNWLKNDSKGNAPTLNWDNTGRSWERDCNFTLINDNKVELNQDCGMRIKGYGGRTNPLKAFNLYARGCYGNKHFKSTIFDGVDTLDSFSLKYDRYSNNSEKFKEGFVESLVEDRNVETEQYRYVVLFINGEYWQYYNIYEKYSDDYLVDKYNCNPNDLSIIKEGALEEGKESDLADYNKMISFLKRNDLSKQANYDKFLEMVDIDSLVNFYAIQAYWSNWDFSYKKNVCVWRRNSTDKWKWMLHDCDAVAIDANFTKSSTGEKAHYNYEFDPFTGRYLFATDLKDDPFFYSVMRNSDYKQLFMTTFMDIANEVLSYNRVLEQVMIKHSEVDLTDEMMTFFEKRPDYVIGYLTSYLKESDPAILTINSSKSIKLNSITPTFKNNTWSGKYYKNICYRIEGDLSNINTSGIEIVSKTNKIMVFKITSDNAEINI